MGATPIKRKSTALVEQCSGTQRLVESYTAKQAILLSPDVIESDMIDIHNLPDDLLQAVHENGLYDKLLTMTKFKFTLPKTGDRIDHFINLLRRYGNIHGNWQGLKV